MKIILSLLILCFFVYAKAQTTTHAKSPKEEYYSKNSNTNSQIVGCTSYPRYRNFLYYYDENGNRVMREFILVCPDTPPTDGKYINPDSLFTESLKDSIPKYEENLKRDEQDGVFKNIYPNPTSGNVIIQFSKIIKNAQLQIFDENGRFYLEENITGAEFNVNLSMLQAGVYYFKIKTTNGLNITKKIVKI